jgi:thiol-disulfide isomerase/thioredoxin
MEAFSWHEAGTVVWAGGHDLCVTGTTDRSTHATAQELAHHLQHRLSWGSLEVIPVYDEENYMSEEINYERRHFTIPDSEFSMFGPADAELGAAEPVDLPTTGGEHITAPMAPAPVADELSALSGAADWLNSAPLTSAELRGKVVLVDFWTYTCINWLRTLPYVRAWADKYKDHGLVVIGVHAPEFSIERNVANVRQAAKAMRVEYPIAIDNDYTIWEAFDNHYWPALYLLDAKGQIRYHQFGEGDYGRSEAMMQQLLAEAGFSGINQDLVSVDARGAEVAADWADLQSGENYVGYERTENFASPGGALPGGPHIYSIPARLKLNHWALSGDWTMGREATQLNLANGRIAYRFHARDLHLVMGPSSYGMSVGFQVRIDGEPPGAAHGIDIDDQGNGTATEQRLYQLIRQPKPITDRQFDIEFRDSGLEAFVFTFG